MMTPPYLVRTSSQSILIGWYALTVSGRYGSRGPAIDPWHNIAIVFCPSLPEFLDLWAVGDSSYVRYVRNVGVGYVARTITYPPV